MKNELNETVKAGCILVSKENRKIGLIYREQLNDHEFAKGHLEPGETITECAVRETAEETKRVAEIVDPNHPFIERYTTPKGEKCVCYYFVADDKGKSDNTSTETHSLIWADIDEVDDIIKYPGLVTLWKDAKKYIKNLYKL